MKKKKLNKQKKPTKNKKTISMKLYNIGLYMKGEQWEFIEITNMVGDFVTTNG